MYTPDGNLLLTDDEWKKDAYNSLPGFMTTANGSNNSKLLNIITDLGNVYKNDMLRLTDQMNIKEASGDLLTNIAKDYGVIRIDSDDEFLRFEVRFTMLKNTLSPNRSAFNNILRYLLRLPSNDFNVIQTGIKEFKVTNIPWNFNSGQHTNVKRKMVSSIIQAIAPPEFKLDFVEYNKVNRGILYHHATIKKGLIKRVKPEDNNYINKILGGIN